jgi:AraC-like DNA-binding protein
MRHRLVHENDPPSGVAVATHSREYPHGALIALHAHGSDQLVYASRGVMEVISGESLWMIPPSFGLWIPARTPHEVRMQADVSMRTLYLRPVLTSLSEACRVLHIGPLLRELIFETVRAGSLRFRNRVERALCDLLVDQLRRASPMPTLVTLPRDARARAVASAVLANPADRSPLRSCCSKAGLSVRTLERVFRREVGLDFERWRRQARLIRAIELLIAGRSVKEAAFQVGYLHPSAFVTAFRSTFATTPKAWIAALNRAIRSP